MRFWKRGGSATVARAFHSRDEFKDFLEKANDQLREPFFEIHRELRDLRADDAERRVVRESVQFLYDMIGREVKDR